MGDDLTEYPINRVRLQPCSICGRQFNTESLKKHQSICRQVTTKKRRVFDAGKQRAAGSDVPYKATKRTMQIYQGEVRAQDDRSKPKSKANWRQKHAQLIQSIREARTVTRAIKEGGPLPAFRPSEIPSDYVACPYCHRNFNEHAAQRHIPFCQAQHERKQVQPSRPNQQFDRGRTLPPPNSFPHKQQSSHSGMRTGPHDVYNNGYKHSNSAPMLVRRNPSELQHPPPPPPLRKPTGGVWGGFKKLLGFNSREEEEPISSVNYYPPEDEYDYEPPVHRRGQQPVLMRTGRTQENTGLNVRARQKNDETSSYMRRGPPPPAHPPSTYSQTRNQYGNGQYNSTRPTAVGRPPQPPPSGKRCNECGGIFHNPSARFCAQCGSRR
ncbi:unnamed protein product [Rotaria sp. Silwood2]|nr:unnamed protein product [Rotaria sp. Silwood2]CAF2987169.1 unnamed protein product [Rotaria sp. Silwood2]CAF3318787.1 unnamed protein product [Rotaria sp. Silwood2]CAF3946617.1 unnamed protein product [Rotaria sp. Silwood2]CAF4385004.1 unnamed protein product [Rotaria sp. Silwood2]